MASLVERIQTPIGPIAFARGVVEAWKANWGEIPKKESVAVLWGQLMTETSGKYIWNYNVGNVKHVAGDGYDWIDLPGTWEVYNGQKVVLKEGDPGRLFRAYPSYGEAFKHHLKFLEKRYGKAWEQVRAGNPKQFVFALKAGRDGKINTADDYFTASLESYEALTVPNYHNFMKGTYYEQALSQLSIVLGTLGKPLPPQQAPVLPAGPSHSDSGEHTTGSSPDDSIEIVSWPTIHKSPYDADWNIDKERGNGGEET